MALRNRKLPRHILVIRNSAMGDVAMVPHALRALREAYPDVRVTVLTRPLFKPFFAGLDVDFLEADYAGRHKGVLGLLRLAGEARRRGIDAVADMHGVLRSRIVGLLLRLHGMPAARSVFAVPRVAYSVNPSSWNRLAISAISGLSVSRMVIKTPPVFFI